VRNRKFIRECKSIVVLLLLLALIVSAASVQALVSAAEQQPAVSSTVVPPAERASLPVARETEMYCGGFIEYGAEPSRLEVVGGEQEQEQRTYSEGDHIYINAGSQQNISIGQEFSVVRPRGRFSTKLTKKKGQLGVYTQEIARVRITEVKDRSSVALVTGACEMILDGDLLRAMPQRVSPAARPEVALDRFANPTGKQTGRIVLARDGRELLSRDQIVFIDLGTEDNIKLGDYLTIYRPAGTGNISRFDYKEISFASSGGFESDTFKGGKFSNKAQRAENPKETANVLNPSVTSSQIKQNRPSVPRKVVGEMVVLNVQARTATAVITRVAQEVHTGDFVELQ
jgi:hypothetical protein